jgi:cell division protein FtsB
VRPPRTEEPLELEEAPRLRGATRLAVPEPLDPAATDPKRPVRVARFVNALLVVLCLIGSVQVIGLIAVEAQRLWHTEREVARLEGEIAAIAAESHDLFEVAARGDDQGYREQLARRQGYVFPFETRFVGPRTSR